MLRRWLFADQLGPEFLDDPAQPVLLVESRAVFRRRRFHRAKAHLLLSALHHRAAELGEQGVLLRTETYGEALRELGEQVSVCGPTSYAADRFVRQRPEVVEVRPERGHATTREEFAAWAGDRGVLRMEDFYRATRQRLGVLMDGAEPAGGRWNLDAENREPPPKGAWRLSAVGVPEPPWPVEDDVDAMVRDTLDRWERDEGIAFVGEDRPRRFAATREEALRGFDHFVTHRLPAFGPYEDAMLADDRWMSHSLVSAPLNLGLLEPMELVEGAELAYRNGHAPLRSVEGYVRQLIGWRDYIWNVYWHFGEDYRHRNALEAHELLPRWFLDLDDSAVNARCLSDVLRDLREDGWVHHIPRLMVLGGYALQRGWSPEALTAWFATSFVDGYDWVMTANVVGMSQHADGGLMATKPYTGGGAYIDRMSDYCGGCAYDPKVRVGERACPYTAGYWAFLHRNRERLATNHRMARPLRGLDRLRDLDELLVQERERGSSPP